MKHEESYDIITLARSILQKQYRKAGSDSEMKVSIEDLDLRVLDGFTISENEVKTALQELGWDEDEAQNIIDKNFMGRFYPGYHTESTSWQGLEMPMSALLLFCGKGESHFAQHQRMEQKYGTENMEKYNDPFSELDITGTLWKRGKIYRGKEIWTEEDGSKTFLTNEEYIDKMKDSPLRYANYFNSVDLSAHTIYEPLSVAATETGVVSDEDLIDKYNQHQENRKRTFLENFKEPQKQDDKKAKEEFAEMLNQVFDTPEEMMAKREYYQQRQEEREKQIQELLDKNNTAAIATEEELAAVQNMLSEMECDEDWDAKDINNDNPYPDPE